TGSAAFSGDGGLATSAAINNAADIAVAPDGGVIISDTGNHRLRRVAPDGTITTFAGTGSGGGFTGDDVPATTTKLNLPASLAVKTDGTVVFADLSNHRVRKVSPAGIITTVAGTGTAGTAGDGGPATSAQLNQPTGVALALDGSVLFAEIGAGTDRVRRVSPGGTITTLAGTGVAGDSGDGGPAVNAQLQTPRGLAVESDGSVLIADVDNHRIRRVSPGGTITTLAGTGTLGFSGDGGPSTTAQLYRPSGVAVETDGSVLIADFNNHRVRRVSPGGTITTVAGTGTAGFSGDGGSPASAKLNFPTEVAVGADGAVLITETGNDRVRRIGAAPAVGPPPAPVPSAPSVPQPPATPGASAPAAALPPVKVASVVTFPSAKACVSRRSFRIRLRSPKGGKLKEAIVSLNGKRVQVVKGKRLTAPVDLRGLPKGRFTVKIAVTLVDGRKVSGTRRYRTCAPKRG
nr:hypothetical protein [Solirubrobacteraceae bacterium]